MPGAAFVAAAHISAGACGLSIDIKSSWGAATLNDAQREYAASDVRYLHRMAAIFEERLIREGRLEIARACFDFLPTRVRLDLDGWADKDIFTHD